MNERNTGRKSPVIFTGCEMTDGMQAVAGGQRRQVVIGGKRIKTIDVRGIDAVVADLAPVLDARDQRVTLDVALQSVGASVSGRESAQTPREGIS